MKKGLCFWSLPDTYSTIEGLHLAKSAGFDGAELLFNENGLCNVNHPNPEQEVQRIANEEGIKLISLTWGPGWHRYFLTHADPKLRAQTRDNLKKMIDMAQKLGMELVLLQCGALDLGKFTIDKRFQPSTDFLDYEAAYDAVLKALLELAPIAESANIVIGLENVVGKFMYSPLEMRNLLDAVDSAHVQCYFDIGNAQVIGNPVDWIRVLGKRIRQIHIKDYRADAGCRGFCGLLAGDVNWPAVAKALQDISFDGYCFAEMRPSYQHYPDQMLFHTSDAMNLIFQA